MRLGRRQNNEVELGHLLVALLKQENGLVPAFTGKIGAWRQRAATLGGT